MSEFGLQKITRQTINCMTNLIHAKRFHDLEVHNAHLHFERIHNKVD